LVCAAEKMHIMPLNVLLRTPSFVQSLTPEERQKLLYDSLKTPGGDIYTCVCAWLTQRGRRRHLSVSTTGVDRERPPSPLHNPQQTKQHRPTKSTWTACSWPTPSCAKRRRRCDGACARSKRRWRRRRRRRARRRQSSSNRSSRRSSVDRRRQRAAVGSTRTKAGARRPHRCCRRRHCRRRAHTNSRSHSPALPCLLLARQRRAVFGRGARQGEAIVTVTHKGLIYELGVYFTQKVCVRFIHFWIFWLGKMG
jgi:hypothetical protein